MLSEENEKMILAYLASLPGGESLSSPQELNRMTSRQLLLLGEEVDDSALGLFVQLLKQTKNQSEKLFEKLLGDHEEENRQLVDHFFNRYMSCVLTDLGHDDLNPLENYLPENTFSDLVFVQSRQAFFMRQTMANINEYLQKMFPSSSVFEAGQQAEAWKYFWQKVLQR